MINLPLAVYIVLLTSIKSLVKKTHGLRRLWKNMPKIDANIILRYIMNDHAELSTKAKKIIEKIL